MVPCTRVTCLLVFLGFILKCQSTTTDYRIIIQKSTWAKEGDDVATTCIESYRAPWAKLALKWFESTYDFRPIRDVETSFRYSIRRCSNATHRCITLLSNNVVWKDNGTLFVCCSGIQKSCDNETKGIQKIVVYKVYSQETKKMFYGQKETLECPINTIHRDDIKIMWRKQVYTDMPTDLGLGKAYTFTHKERLRVSYTCEAKDNRKTPDGPHQKSQIVTNYRKHTFHVETQYKDKLLLTMKSRLNVTKQHMKDFILSCVIKNAKDYRGITKVKWYKDGLIVTGRHWIKSADDTFMLRPYTAYKNDINGMYECEITEGKTTVRTSAEIRVVGILNVTLIGPNILEERKTYKFNCKTSGFPKADKFIWHLKGDYLHSDADPGFVLEPTRSDHGILSCTAMNKYGNGTDKKLINVHYRPEVEVARVTAAVGGLAEMKCKIESKPEKKTIVWKHNDKRIEGKREILKIQSVKRKDEGKYKCIVTNAIGEGYGTGRLIVVDGSFVSFPSDKQVNQHATVTLPCATRDLHRMERKRNWYKDDIAITEKDQVLNEPSTYAVTYNVNESTYNYTLVITNIKYRHHGNYTCEMGVKNVSAYVAVTVPPKRPVITRSTSYKEDLKHNVTCTSNIQNVYPQPVFSWYQDGRRLKNESQKSSSSNETIHRVSISPTVKNNRTASSVLSIVLHSEDHKSLIECAVENSVGSKKRSFRLNVTFAPIIQSLGSGRLIAGGATILLTCKYTANPNATFFGWFKTSTSNKIHDSPTLTIKKAEENDTGTYSCKVGNREGNQSASIRIDVVGSFENVMPQSAEGSSLGVIIGGTIVGIVVLSVIPIAFFCGKKKAKRKEIFLGFVGDDGQFTGIDYGDSPLPEKDQPYQMNDRDQDMGDVPKWKGSRTSINISTGKKKKNKKKNQTSISNSSTVSDGKKKRKKKKQKKKKGSNTSLNSKASVENTASGDASVSGEKGKKKKKEKKNQKGGSRTSLRSEKNQDISKKKKSKKQGGSRTSLRPEKNEDKSKKRESTKKAD